ncbi:MAG: radical SAM protein [Kiritimatiellae bacterium]|nr:radical SAM protein [Kiritimatiellia bacterium]
MTPFSLLVKPVGARCNLACDYCFYLGKASLYPNGPTKMSDAVLERMIESYLSLPFDSFSIAFQGGEPMLAGLDFFRRANDFAKRVLPDGLRLSLSIQTNATLVTREAAKFFADEGWLVGVSVDGPAKIHDAHRTTPDGRGTHAEVLRGIDALREAGCDYNVLTLVTKSNVSEPKKIYRYVRDELGGKWQQYTDHLESISTQQWDAFLCGVLDAWLEDGDMGRVSVRNIDAALSYATFGRAEQCLFAGRCDGHVVVERNGDVYPCDFFVTKETLLGNIMDCDWSELRESRIAQEFATKKCVRHLSKIDRMEFYDRISALAAAR